MPHDEPRKFSGAQPFFPSRINLTDGRHFDVRHPDQVIVTRQVAYVGVWSATEEITDRVMPVALTHVVSAEPLEHPVTG